ncbi:MAG TPA: acetoin dehydrogenase dihydrolipoyllysine-residue acetyltransferase subunit [Acetobacteraceae bacterium]|jgi:pyruvate dehydrogenase E2 component (dihydrolipoamide acetyltransferase)
MITAITMPKWGLTMTEGKVVTWLQQPGASFSPGDELLEIETSKITNVVEAESPGTLIRIVASEGTTLPIGALLAVVAPADTPAAEIDAFVSGFVVPEQAEDAAAESDAPAPREIDAGGRRLRYLEMGSSDRVPVLLLHGFGADLNSWMFTQPALAEGRRAIALDLPGHGGSTKDVGTGDAATLADAVVAAMDVLALQRAHLVGHSMGGAIAATVAARNPARIASLTLIASAGLGPDINAAFIDGFVRAARRKDAVEVLQMLVRDPSLVSRAMVEDVLRYKRLDGVAAALETVARAWFPGGRQAVDVTAVINDPDLPVQLLWGRDDRIVPVTHGEALAPRRPVHVLDAAGHLPHMEKSADVNRLIRRFIEGV